MLKALLLIVSLVVFPTFIRADDTNKKDKPKVEVADYKKLKEALPEKLGGLDRSNLTGQRTKQGDVSMAMAEAKYGKDEGDAPKTVSVSVVDYIGMGDMAAGLASWEKMEMNQEGDEGFTKTDTVNGHKVLLSYQTGNKSGTIQVMINGRLIVSISAQNISGDELKAIAKEFNTEKLSAAAPAPPVAADGKN